MLFVVQLLIPVRFSYPADCSMPNFSVLHHLLELAQTQIFLSNHLIPCPPLFLVPLIFPSIRVFSNELALCIRWPKYWSLSISPSNEYWGFISFWIDWFYLLAVQGTLKSLLQHFSLVHLPFFLFAMSCNFGSNWHPSSVTMKVKVAQSCPTLWAHGLYIHGILQARILQWVAFLFSRGSFQPRDRTQVSHIAGGYFYQLNHKGGPGILEWVAYPFSSGSAWPRNRTGVSCIAGRFFTNSAIREAPLLQLNCQ